jgi:hypothetical protein
MPIRTKPLGGGQQGSSHIQPKTSVQEKGMRIRSVFEFQMIVGFLFRSGWIANASAWRQ